MTIDRSAASLLGLDAIVIDTETTGLDPRKARIVEFAAMPLVAGRLDQNSSVRWLVNPGARIPVEAVRIHGIDNLVVAGAPDFGSVWPEISASIGANVVIGHTLDFDLAVLALECKRIGATFNVGPTLDVRLMAELAEPHLADFSLESLAAWLGVEVVGRHSALGDVITTGNVFSALVPRLRDRGIRTFAEIRRVSSALAERSPGYASAGGGATAPAGAGENRNRIDVSLYRQRVASIMTAPAHIVGSETTLGAALETMTQMRISSVFVSSNPRPVRAEHAGIVTERDVLRALATHGGAALAMPVAAAMSQPLRSVSSDALAHVAVARMNRLRVRHLGVTDSMGNVVGAVSARDLLRLRAESAVELGDQIQQAADVHELARAWTKLPQVAAELLQEGLSARQIAALISHECRDVTGRAVALAEASMKAEGKGAPPAGYTFLVLGSAGRDESLLAMDQDNALVLADDMPEPADRWFEQLASRAADILHQVGVPYCKGGVMAKNPQWRGTIGTWQKRIDQWVGRSNPQDLLSVDIFFDFQAVSGDPVLAEKLRQYAFGATQGQAAFAKLLHNASGMPEPALKWYGGIRTVNGRVDLKKAGLFGIVSGVRTLAICRHITERSTLARLEKIKAGYAGAEGDLDALADAQEVFIDLIIRQQINDIGRGRSPDNTVEMGRLSRRDRQRLRTSLKAVEHVNEITESWLFEK